MAGECDRVGHWQNMYHLVLEPAGSLVNPVEWMPAAGVVWLCGRPLRPPGGCPGLVSAFGQRHRQDQHGEWQADCDGESERDHCPVLCCVMIADPRG